MRPNPTMPTVFSSTSTPPYLLRFHAPLLSAWFAGAMLRALARSSPTASSAAEVMFEVGALTTMTPAFVALGTSTLSSPTPARAMTLRFFATAIASAFIFVAERIRTASTDGRAASNTARSDPSQLRISKSGPRASMVAGDSSSAIRTMGLLMANPALVLQGSQPRMPCGHARWPTPVVGWHLAVLVGSLRNSHIAEHRAQHSGVKPPPVPRCRRPQSNSGAPSPASPTPTSSRLPSRAARRPR